MSTIKRNDGVQITWEQEVEGPVQELNPMGAPIDLFTFKAKVDVGDSDVHEVIVWVPGSTLGVLGPDSSPERDELARQCLVQYLEEHFLHSPVPEREENFRLYDPDTMRGLKAMVLRQPRPKRLLCKVALPRKDGTETEYEVVEVNSLDNAVIKLKRRMFEDAKYNWDLAQVVEWHEK